MSSGFPGGGDFYTPTSFGGGGGGGSGGGNGGVGERERLLMMMNNNVYRSSSSSAASQIGNDYMAQSQPLIPHRRADYGPKRPFTDQQQALLRSVKQRSQYNHTSPISPLTPFDFGSSLPNNPLLQQQLRSLPYNSNNGGSSSLNLVNPNPNLNPLNPSNFLLPTNEKNRLQELEKALLDDDNEDEEYGEAAVAAASSGVTSEWSETMQSLLSSNQNLNVSFSPSPSSSGSSSTISSVTSCSSKHYLIDIANAICEGKMDFVATNIEKLKQISNPRGDPDQRLTFYMVSALKSKMNPVENPPPVIDLCNSEHVLATHKLYEASPCFKLGFMAANLAILESLRDEPNKNVHVVDFDVGHGIQYMSLIHALAEKHFECFDFGTVLKITTVSDSVKGEDMKLVGDQLKKLADRVGVTLKFNVVSQNIKDLNAETLFCKPGEALFVNFAFKLYKMPDESVCLENRRDELLRLVKRLAPRLVTVVEQEMNCNTASFVARVREVSSYYLALFNSLDSTMNRDGTDRVRIEECLGKKMVNSVACEGRDRVERCEVFGKWRARMGMAGFASKALGQSVAELMRSRLSSGYKNGNPGFTVKEEAGGICFGWNGRVLTVASAWR